MKEDLRRIRTRFSQRLAALRGWFCCSHNTGAKFSVREASASHQESYEKAGASHCLGVIEGSDAFGKILMTLRDHERLE